jgi:hypothetical protein
VCTGHGTFTANFEVRRRTTGIHLLIDVDITRQAQIIIFVRKFLISWLWLNDLAEDEEISGDVNSQDGG